MVRLDGKVAMITGGSTRAERRRARARAQLMDAARTLIAERGVEGLRVSDITDRADFAFGSFYNHFGTKDDVVDAIVSETVRGLAQRIAGMTAAFDDPAEQASVALRSFVRLAYDEPQLAALLLNLHRTEARFETMVWPHARSVVQRGIDEGRFSVGDPDTALMMAVGSTLAIITGILEGHLGPDCDISFSEMMLHILGLPRGQAAKIASRPLPQLVSQADE
jgi:AcrR family transcriptional regulator